MRKQVRALAENKRKAVQKRAEAAEESLQAQKQARAQPEAAPVEPGGQHWQQDREHIQLASMTTDPPPA